MAERSALVCGATGLVGGGLLEQLLADGHWGRVTAIGRRAPAVRHDRLATLAAGLDGMEDAARGGRWDDAFCCLGTTMKKAGSAAAFRAVDLDGVTAFARGARAGGATFFGLVSAAGASMDSRNFYLRTKGQAERAVETAGFASVAILQPGVLRGERAESRPAERLAILAAPVTDLLMQGPLARYRSVDAKVVAAALLAAAIEARPGVRRIGPEEMKRLAAGRRAA